MSKIKMSDITIAKYIGEMCFEPNLTKERQAIQLFFEKMCLPKSEIGYTAEEMAKYIVYFMKHKKIFTAKPHHTHL